MRYPAFRPSLVLLLALLFAACDSGGGNEEPDPDGCRPEALPFQTALEQTGAIRYVHDPVVIKHDEQYTLFYTGPGIPIRRSDDLVRWEEAGTVFSMLPDWATREIPGVEFPWAPDISFYNDRYHLYYSVSTFGSQRSAIGLATTPTLDPNDPDYAWTDRGKVVESRPGDDYNAIDPNVAFDEDGQPWLAWGSYWGGIKLRRLDAETGLLADEDTTVHTLAARPVEDAVEAPFIVRHAGYYYLFVSWDQCCEGTQSTYKIVVGRSEDITGPYVDRDGTPMAEGGGTLVLAGHGRVRGPGHNAVLAEGDRHYLVHHFYDAEDAQEAGVSKLQIRSLVWGEDGWPLAGVPYDGTSAAFPSAEATPDVAGRWAHAVDFTQPVEIRLRANGDIERCDDDGAWSLDGAFLTLQWPVREGATWVAHTVVGADGTWYVGRDEDGYVVQGHKTAAE